MKEGIIVGMALGFIIGAVLVTSNKDVQSMVNKGKKMVKDTMKKTEKDLSN